MASKSRKDKGAWIALGLAGTALAVSLWVSLRDPEVEKQNGQAAKAKAENDNPGPDMAAKPASMKPGHVMIGGVQRPATDLAASFGGEAGKFSGSRQQSPLSYGKTQPIDPDSNVHTRSIAEAVRTGKFPERLTTIVPPKPFDPDAYQSDPDAYLNIVEPGRVFQPAQPGPGVSRLQYVSKYREGVTQGTAVPLQVKASPGAPVTFTSFDLGEFQNLLNTITVRADDQGVATALFKGGPGTIGNVDVLAASPVTSGQLRFAVLVQLPKPAG